MDTTQSSTKEILLEEITSVAGPHALDTVTPTPDIPIAPPPEVPNNVASEDGFTPTCVTQNPLPKFLQRNKNLHSIAVGLAHECPRWVPGSVIKWVALKEGFKTPADADYAAAHLNRACEQWNALNVGVTFEWVKSTADATFALCHGGDNGGVLASAFFPNANDLSMMLVYSGAFGMPKWKANLWKVFTHELGHVLGLRHEFALDVNTEGVAVEVFKAVQLGPRNRNSVMAYKNVPPEIQDTDVESTRAFYSLRDDENGNPPMVGLTVVQDYEPL